MKIEWQTTLIQRYPLFFRKPTELSEVEVAALDEEIHDDGPVDAWGIECGDGWFGILDGLISQFEQHIQVLKANGVPKKQWPRCRQIKEKFGELRFHYSNAARLPDSFHAAVEAAERASAITCERCGNPGELRRSGYFQVICADCFNRPSEPSELFDTTAHFEKLAKLLASRSD